MTMTAEFGVNPANSFSDEYSQVIQLADGGFVVAWTGTVNTGTIAAPILAAAVQAQYYNADGTPRGGSILVDVVPFTAGSVSAINGVQMAGGNVAFTWQTSALSGGGATDILARIYDASGASVSGPHTITAEPGTSQYPDDIVALPGGGFAVFWQSTQFPVDSPAFGEITGQMFAADGSAAGAAFTVNSNLAGKQSDARAAVLANGDFVVTWVDRGSANYSPDFTIRAQRYDSTGAAQGGEVSLTQPTGTNESVFTPSITATADGGYLVAWRFGVSADAYRGQMFDAAGAATSSVLTLMDAQANHSLSTSNIAARPDGGFAVFYTEFNPGPAATTTDPMMQLFDAAGMRVGGEIQLAASIAGAQDFNVGTVLANGDIAVSWTAVGGAQEIRARVISVPVIASTLGNGAAASPVVLENTVSVTTFSATSTIAGPLTWSLAGADAGLFTLDPLSLELRFIDRPYTEIPADAGADNVYDVTVRVSNGVAVDEQRLAITVAADPALDTFFGTAAANNFYPIYGQKVAAFGFGGNDHLEGAQFDDFIVGGDGADSLYGLAGNDQLTGDAGNDTLYGHQGQDTLRGGLGNDNLFGDADADVLEGGAGNDNYIFAENHDTLIEAADGGTDLVTTYENWTLASNFENLVLLGTAGVSGTGNEAANQLTGNAGNNHLSGLGGNDRIDGGAGDDTMDGGAGNDTFTVNSAADVVIEANAGGTDLVNASVSYALSEHVEKLTLKGAGQIDGTGNAQKNTITGNGGNNRLYGLGDKDTLNGGIGDDQLYGGLAADILTGGAGADQFVFDTLETSAAKDTIKDFEHGVDQLVLEDAVFTALAAGALDPAALALGSAASTGDHRLIYNQATGALYYDADGSGAGTQIQIAVLASKPMLDEGDFLVL